MDDNQAPGALRPNRRPLHHPPGHHRHRHHHHHHHHHHQAPSQSSSPPSLTPAKVDDSPLNLSKVFFPCPVIMTVMAIVAFCKTFLCLSSLSFHGGLLIILMKNDSKPSFYDFAIVFNIVERNSQRTIIITIITIATTSITTMKAASSPSSPIFSRSSWIQALTLRTTTTSIQVTTTPLIFSTNQRFFIMMIKFYHFLACNMNIGHIFTKNKGPFKILR